MNILLAALLYVQTNSVGQATQWSPGPFIGWNARVEESALVTAPVYEPPTEFPSGISITQDGGPLVVYVGGKGYALVPVPDANMVLPVQVSSSPLPDAKVVLATIEAARSNATAKAGIVNNELGRASPQELLRAIAIVENQRINALVDVIRNISRTTATTNQTAAIRMTGPQMKQAIQDNLP